MLMFGMWVFVKWTFFNAMKQYGALETVWMERMEGGREWLVEKWKKSTC